MFILLRRLFIWLHTFDASFLGIRIEAGVIAPCNCGTCYYKRRVKRILFKFYYGAEIENREEKDVLERYASTGMISFAKKWKVSKGGITFLSQLTTQGRWFVRQL